MEHGHDWLVFVLIFVGILYVGGPLLTYAKVRQAAEPDPIQVDTDQSPLPSVVQDYFTRVENALRTCGFERVDDIALPNQVTNVAANVRLFVNRENRDSASCTAAYLRSGQTWNFKVKYVQFLTIFRDETVYVTSNSQVLSSFPPRPGCQNNKFPRLANPVQLYEVHQAIVREPSRMRTKSLPLIDEFQGDGVAYQRWSLKRELQDATNAGCLYLHESTQSYRPTLIGAFMMTWKLLWPWKVLQVRERNRNAARILAEFKRSVD